MKLIALFSVACLVTANLMAQTSELIVTVANIPPEAAEIIAVIDPPPPPELDYRERRQRRLKGVEEQNPVRLAQATSAASTATLKIDLPAKSGYQVRVIALGKGTRFPAVIAGGKVDQVDASAAEGTAVEIVLAAPEMTFSPSNPGNVSPGDSFQISGIISDPASFVGGKAGRMRVWTTDGSAPTENFSGTQFSTVALETTDDGRLVSFTFDMEAPAEPTTLFLQFGETNALFCREDGSLAPFLVIPDVENGAAALMLPVIGSATVASANE